MKHFQQTPRGLVSRTHIFVGLALLCAIGGANCAGRALASARPEPGVAVTVDDMMGVRDLYGLTISPDGKSLAVYETYLDVSDTAIEGRWLIFSTATGALRARSVSYDVVIDDVGLVNGEVPQWSADSQTLAFRVGSAAGPTLMTLSVDGISNVVRVGAGEAVGRFTFAHDGGLIVESIGTAGGFREAEDRERAQGVDVDTVDAAEPLFGNQYTGSTSATVRFESSNTRRWSVRLGQRKRYWRWDPASGAQLLGPDAAAMLGREKAPDDVGGYVLQNEGAAPNDRGMPSQQKRLAYNKNGRRAVCDDPRCVGRLIGIMGVDQEGAVLFSREGLSDTRAIYRWRPMGKITALTAEKGAVSASSRDGQQPCLLSGSAIYCVYSDPWTPPQIRRTSISDGRSSIVYSPNRPIPGLDALEIRQVHWQGPNPGPSSGVLVLPRHRAGPLPLVLSSYRCRGFLRGGVGFDALEYVLASRGVAVLCVALSQESTADSRPLGIHRRFAEEIASAVKYLAAAGIADPRRVAVSGRSLSAEAVTYAITHGQKFAAASSVGSSIADPIWSKMYDLSEGAFFPVALYYHHLSIDGGDAAEASPAMSAKNMDTPLLMQPPETEFRGSLEFYYALKKLRKPVEMIVYPDELHQIVQPRHMRLNAQRNIDWFMFWLMNQEDVDPGKAGQYERWRKMRPLAP